MEKLDRLTWPAVMTFSSYGVRVGVRANEPRALEYIPALLPPASMVTPLPVVDRLYSIILGGPTPTPGVRRFNLLYGDFTRLARTREPAPLFDALESDLQLYIAEWARRRTFIHAGVVAWRGKAIMMPGKTLSGKTTLVAELVRAGATYYSDEYAVLDARGRVHPYPKPLSIRPAPTAKGEKLPIQALGGTVGHKPIPVGMVVLSEYRDGARWRPRALSPGQGALELFAHAVAAQRNPQTVLARLSQAVAHAAILKGVRGEAHQIADAILEQM